MYVTARMAITFSYLALHFFMTGQILYFDYILRYLFRKIYPWLENFALWLQWISTIFILKIWHSLFYSFGDTMIILHYCYVFFLQPIFSSDSSRVDRTISFRKRLRSRFFDLPTSDERHLLFSTYRISSKDVFLFRLHSYFSTLFSHEGPFLSLLRVFHHSYSNLVDSTSRYPPEGPILLTLLGFLATIASFGVHFYFAYMILRKRGSLSSPDLQSPTPRSMEPSSPQIYSTVVAYSTEQMKNINSGMTFTPGSTTAIVDNSANTHIWSERSDFRKGSLKPYSSSRDRVMTVGSTSLLPQGIGDVDISWHDDHGNDYSITLENVLFFPDSPVNVISCTAFANQLGDDEGTWIQTKRQYSVFTWDFGKYTRTISHPSSNLPEIQLNPSKGWYVSFVNLFRPQCYFINKPLASRTLLPEVRKDDISFLDEIPQDRSFETFSKSPKNSTFAIGEKVKYTRDDHHEVGTLTSIDLDSEKLVPIFNISFGGSRTISTTKEFISHFDDIDPMELPITREQLLKFSSMLSQKDLDDLLTCSSSPSNPLRDEFIQWHFKLNHLPFKNMFSLCRNGYLPKKFLRLKSSDLICPSCILGNQKRRPWRVRNQSSSIRKPSETKPGDRVSIDQMISHQPGLVPRYSGRHTRDRITCVTCFKDHVSDFSYSYLQRSSDGESTLNAKHSFESMNSDFGVSIKSYHADNGRFAEKSFRDDISNCQQSISFCGVGSHHQNGIIERHIGLLTSGARTTLLHAQRSWPEAITTLLWPFAWLETEFRMNHLHLNSEGKSPVHRHTGVEVRLDVSKLHTWGCPAFVLDAKAQVGQSIPKWDPKSRLGIYVGRSKNHAGNVALILNPQTLHVSPQFHVVFDDTFSTVKYLRNGEVPPNWTELVRDSSELVTDEAFDAATMYTTDNNMLLDGDQVPSSNKEIISNLPTVSTKRVSFTPDTKPPSLDSEGVSQSVSSSPSSPIFGQLADLNEMTLRRSPRIKALREKQALESKTVHPSRPKGSFFSQFHSFVASTVSYRPKEHFHMHIEKAVYYFENTHCNFDGTLNALHHYAFVGKNAGNDTFTLSSMMKQHDRSQFIQAMLKEVDDHESRGHWSLMERKDLPSDCKTIMAIWSFKRKRKPDGTIYKHKARLCAHGGMQKWGVNFWETYAPVVNWLSVRTLLILSLILNLHTRSIDFVLAFPQAKLDVDVYMEIPFGFTYDESRRYVLKLEKNLYGLKQAAYNWYEMLKGGLEARGFQVCNSDNCIFFRKDAIVLTYVDDCVIFTEKKEVADDIISSLKAGNENFDFTDDGDLLQYLGISLERKGKQLHLVQPHLISRILDTLELDAKTTSKPSPAVKPLLHKDLEGLDRKATWGYRQVIGMLNYLQNSTRPDLSMAVHQAARFSINPKLSHERAVKRIGKYLLSNRDKGLIFTPDRSRGIEVYVDADFAGSWDKADAMDSSNVLSRTGYVIMFCGAPVLWCSKLQTEIALSTAEAEYIALSMAMRAVIPLLQMFQELKGVFGIHSLVPVVKCRVFEDNESAIAMSKNKKFTPRTKHIALKYHHFRKFVSDKTINILSVDTREQIADILTKPVELNQFIYLRRKLSGW